VLLRIVSHLQDLWTNNFNTAGLSNTAQHQNVMETRLAKLFLSILDRVSS